MNTPWNEVLKNIVQHTKSGIIITIYYRFSQTFSNFFHSFPFKEQFNFIPKMSLSKSWFQFQLVSSNFNIVSFYFVIISLIFVIVTILFVLPCRWVVNHKINFVLCHSFSHIVIQFRHRCIGLFIYTSLLCGSQSPYVFCFTRFSLIYFSDIYIGLNAKYKLPYQFWPMPGFAWFCHVTSQIGFLVAYFSVCCHTRA